MSETQCRNKWVKYTTKNWQEITLRLNAHIIHTRKGGGGHELWQSRRKCCYFDTQYTECGNVDGWSGI